MSYKIWKDLNLSISSKTQSPHNTILNYIRILNGYDIFTQGDGIFYCHFSHKFYSTIDFRKETLGEALKYPKELTTLDKYHIITNILESPDHLKLTQVDHKSLNKALEVIAKAKDRNLALEYQDKCLTAYKRDEKPILEKLFHEYFNTDDTEYYKNLGVWLGLALCKRVLEPGSQLDEMLILESDQGFYKSSAVRLLGGGVKILNGGYNEYYQPFSASVNTRVDSKDFIISLLGLRCVEIDELSSFKGKDLEKIKSIITTRRDRIRLPYKEQSEDIDRTCIFIGTTNKRKYLTERENRRFLPCEINKPIDIESLEKILPRIYGEAMYRILKDKNALKKASIDINSLADELRVKKTEVDIYICELEYILHDLLRRKKLLFHNKKKRYVISFKDIREIFAKKGLISKKIEDSNKLRKTMGTLFGEEFKFSRHGITYTKVYAIPHDYFCKADVPLNHYIEMHKDV